MYEAYPPSTVYPVNSAFSHRFSFPERQYSQRPSVRCSQGTPTRVSSGYLSAPLPCSSTFPITWCPGTTGDRRDGNSPSTTCRSVRQTPQTLTRIKISPGPGDGLGASLHCNGFNSTGPGESSAQACMGRSFDEAASYTIVHCFLSAGRGYNVFLCDPCASY